MTVRPLSGQITRSDGESSVWSQVAPSKLMQNRDMTSKTTRIAAASLLALTLPLVQGTAAHADVRPATIVPVRSQTEVVTRDITLAAVVSLSLPTTVRAQVDSAIMSAQAATSSAQSAITAVDTADAYSLWSAQASLQDARTALDAASAELRYVTSAVADVDPDVSAALSALQTDIDVLRGAGEPAAA